ncbi:MAG: hypothetical protein LBF61_00730 [Azoarcus sp.]|nr:hypothetical protein [Azoarcus sp.]
MNDWLPHKREEILNVSQLWQAVITTAKATAWSIPTAEMTALKTLATAAETALAANQPPVRNSVTAAQCDAAFKALTDKLRFLKNRYFLVPPLMDSDIVSLGLKPRDAKPTPIPPPVAQAGADISYPGTHQLKLHFRLEPDTPPDPHHSDYGYRTYYGILPHGGADVAAATSVKRELMKAPTSGEELPHSRFTRRQSELFDFDQNDSGKTAYFCIRFENAKGEPGPWGPIFSSVIP